MVIGKSINFLQFECQETIRIKNKVESLKLVEEGNLLFSAFKLKGKPLLIVRD
jgi:nucleoid-associated protein YejK